MARENRRNGWAWLPVVGVLLVAAAVDAIDRKSVV